MRHYQIFVIIILAVIITVLPAFSLSLKTTVKYISQSTIYIDSGRINGIQQGDKGDIYHNSELIAKVEIIFVADNSASCRIVEQFDDIQVGDAAILEITEPEEVKIEEAPADTVVIESVSPVIKSTERRSKKSKISGRIGFQYYAQNNLDQFNYDYQQPSVSLNFKISDIADSHHELSVRMRSRRNMVNAGSTSITQSDWDNRLYEMSLRYNNPYSPISYSIGRQLSNQISGMGYIDGVMFSYKLRNNYSVGFFGGTQPDMQTSSIMTDETKGGIYATYEHRNDGHSSLNATVALAGQYVTGQIDEEFLYQQISYSLNNKLYIYQSSELSINRGWRKEASGTSYQLSNLLVNLQYNFSRSINANIGYDNRQNVYNYYNRSTPDSLFDDAMREGYRAGVNFRLPMSLRLSTNANFRFQNDGTKPSEYLNAGINTANLFNTQTFASYRVATFNNQYSSGLQHSVSFSRYIIGQLNMGIHFGQNNYNYSAFNEKVVDNWVKVSGDYLFNRRFYSSAYIEFDRGSDFNSNRIFIDFGVRL